MPAEQRGRAVRQANRAARRSGRPDALDAEPRQRQRMSRHARRAEHRALREGPVADDRTDQILRYASPSRPRPASRRIERAPRDRGRGTVERMRDRMRAAGPIRVRSRRAAAFARTATRPPNGCTAEQMSCMNPGRSAAPSGASADRGHRFEDGDLAAGLRQDDGGGQAVGSGADDDGVRGCGHRIATSRGLVPRFCHRVVTMDARVVGLLVLALAVRARAGAHLSGRLPRRREPVRAARSASTGCCRSVRFVREVPFRLSPSIFYCVPHRPRVPRRGAGLGIVLSLRGARPASPSAPARSRPPRCGRLLWRALPLVRQRRPDVLRRSAGNRCSSRPGSSRSSPARASRRPTCC